MERDAAAGQKRNVQYKEVSQFEIIALLFVKKEEEERVFPYVVLLPFYFIVNIRFSNVFYIKFSRYGTKYRIHKKCERNNLSSCFSGL